MKPFFKTEQDVHAENAVHFEELTHYGSISAEGVATPCTNQIDNVDPHSGSAYTGLSVQRAAGLVSAKVGKRKSRLSRKVPIKVFSADSTSFMAMVHKLTGFQSSAYLLPQSPQNSLLKPVAARPSQPFMQGLYMPADSLAGDKMNANFSDDSFSCALSQIKSSLSGRQQFDSINIGSSLFTNEGLNTLHGPTSANRFHNPDFEALHLQILRNSNSLGPSSGVAFLPSRGPVKEDCRKGESCADSFNEQRMLHNEISAVRH